MAITWMFATHTSLGTSTTKTLLNGGAVLNLPEQARCIRSIIPVTDIDTPTAAQAVYPKIELESDDFIINPYAVLGPVIGASLGGNFGNFGSLPERFPVNANCPGGAKLRAYGTALVANTSAPTAGIGIEISTDPAPLPRVKGVMGTITSTGTATGAVSGTAYTFTGGNKLIEAYGAIGATTVAAKESVNGYFKFESTEFTPNLPVQVPICPMGSGLSLDAAGTASNVEFMAKMIRCSVDIGIKPALTRIQDYAVFGAVPGTAGYFVTGVLYI